MAVLFSAGLTKEERFDRQLAVATELSARVGREVDVIDLAASSLVLQHQVLVYGKCVFERDSRARVEFEIASRRAYFDLKRIRDRHTAGMVPPGSPPGSRGNLGGVRRGGVIPEAGLTELKKTAIKTRYLA